MLIACPSCQKQLQVPDSAVGKKVKCPSCAAVFEALANTMGQFQAEPPPLTSAGPSVSREEDGEEQPWRRRADSDEDEDRRDDGEDQPRRTRRRWDNDDDGDDEFRRVRSGGRGEATRGGSAASIWFMIAGIVTLVMITLSIISNFYVQSRMPAVGGPQAAAYRVGQVVGLLGCGVVVVIGAIFHFMASSNLKSFQNKGMVVTAVVFAFIFGVLFGIGVIINLALISQVPPGFLSTLVVIAIVLGGSTSAVNLIAAIVGLVALNNPAVSRAFGPRRRY
jgi:predicted Zn finger-like uncharacterized protein